MEQKIKKRIGLLERCRRKPIEIKIRIARKIDVGNGKQEKFSTIEQDLDELLSRVKNLEKKHGKIKVVVIVG